jgi:hypothetical protein
MVLLIIAVAKALVYFYATCGLLHYLLTQYNDEIQPEELKQIAFKAVKNID